MSHLFRYEDQDALKVFLEVRLNTEIRLERKNVSPQAPMAPQPGDIGASSAQARG